MDRGARDRIVNGRVGKGISALLLLALLLFEAGCHRGASGWTPPPPVREEVAGDNTAPAEETVWLPPVVATDGAGEAAGVSPADNTSIDNHRGGQHCNRRPGGKSPPLPGPMPEAKAESDVSPARNPATRIVAFRPQAEAGRRRRTRSRRHRRRARHDASPPEWAKSPEELVYRVDFIGITMGYARFRYVGKVSIAGKPAYHLNVRAWTSGVLSYIYPINETIDYYLDAETLAPIRQEFTQREKEKDDVALYNQETGKITYRYRQSGKIRKQVDTIPSVYDPVSVAYYFRWKDLGVENRPRNMYGVERSIRSPREFSGTSGSARNTGRWTRSRSFR